MTCYAELACGWFLKQVGESGPQSDRLENERRFRGLFSPLQFLDIFRFALISQLRLAQNEPTSPKEGHAAWEKPSHRGESISASGTLFRSHTSARK